MSSNQSQENKNTQNFIQVIDKHIIGGSKKGRKKVGTEVFKKYENNTVINQIDENICKQMTLKQLRRTAYTRNYIMIHKIVQQVLVNKELVLEINLI